MLLPTAVPDTFAGTKYTARLTSIPLLTMMTPSRLPLGWGRQPASFLKPYLAAIARGGEYEERRVGNRTVYFWAEHSQGAAWQEGPFTYLISDKFTLGEGEQAISAMAEMIASSKPQTLSASWRPTATFPLPDATTREPRTRR